MPGNPHPSYSVRSAGINDRDVVRSLIDNHEYYHHHLDWQSPLDWLGEQPFLILQEVGRDIAALGCPPSPPGIGWIRLFAALDTSAIQSIWETLLKAVIERSTTTGLELLCGLGIAHWFVALMENSHFHHHQDVVGLSKRLDPTFTSAAPAQTEIREATAADIPLIAALDARAFDRMWQHTQPTLQLAYDQAGYFSVALSAGEIIGYQLSTTSSTSAHLARLAVEPRFQNKLIGSALIADLFDHCINQDIYEISVNTQSDNQASLALYTRLGFNLTGEKYPVFVFHLP